MVQEFKNNVSTLQSLSYNLNNVNQSVKESDKFIDILNNLEPEIELKKQKQAKYVSGQIGIDTNSNGVPSKVSYFDSNGNLLTTSTFNAESILKYTDKFSIPLNDLKSLGNQLDDAKIGYRPYKLYPDTGSDHGIDFDDLINGGLGTAYDWRKDVNADLKDSYLVGTASKDQASNIVKNNQDYADKLSLVKNHNITTEQGIDISAFNGNRSKYIVNQGNVVSVYNTENEAKEFQNANGGDILNFMQKNIFTPTSNTLKINNSALGNLLKLI